jgi:hypothetical protein
LLRPIPIASAVSSRRRGRRVLASTRLRLFDRDAAYAELAYGPGVGRYRGAASATLDAAGRLHTLDVVGLTAGYQHYWSDRWSSNVVVSPAWVVNDVGNPATSDDSFNYVALNLLYWSSISGPGSAGIPVWTP